MLRNRSYWAGFASLLVVGCGSPPTAVPPSPPKVTVQPPEARSMHDFVEYNGWIEADKKVEVRARVRGHIHKVNFTDGQFVKANEVLFELDPRPFQSEVDKTQEKVKVYESQREAAVKEEARLKELLSKGGASKSQVEKAEADSKSFTAQIAAAEEEINRQKLDVGYAKIKAEIAGKVDRALLQEGNLVNAGGSDPLLTTIVAVDPVRISFNIDERILQQFAQNMGAAGKNPTELMARLKDEKAEFKFALDGQTDFAHSGTLSFGANQIDKTTGTLPVYGTADNKPGKLMIGSRVRVRVFVGKPYPALLVPDTAILTDQGKRYILLADDKNVVRRQNVVIGDKLTDDGMRRVQPDGANVSTDPPEKWRVLVDNLQRARVNYPVEPQSPTAAKPAEPTPTASDADKSNTKPAG